MARKPKQRLGLYDLGRIPVTPTQNTSGYEDSRTLLKRLQQEERDAQAAPLRAAVAKVEGLRAEIAEVNADLTTFWKDTPYSQMTWEAAPVDVLTDYEMLPEGQLPPTALEFTRLWDEAYSKFCREVDAKGLVFSPEAGDSVRKLAAFVRVLFQKRNVALTAGNFWLAFRKLYSLGAITGVTGFTETEAIPSQYQAVASIPLEKELEQAQAPRKQADPIENTNDKEALLDLIGAEWGRDVQAIFLQWVDTNMVPIWGVERDVMVSPRVTKFIGEVLMRHPELNPLRPQTWDFVRRAIDYAQLVRRRGSLLLPEERLAASIEETPLTNADFATKQDLVRRLGEVR